MHKSIFSMEGKIMSEYILVYHKASENSYRLLCIL